MNDTPMANDDTYIMLIAKHDEATAFDGQNHEQQTYKTTQTITCEHYNIADIY